MGEGRKEGGCRKERREMKEGRKKEWRKGERKEGREEERKK